MHGNTFEVKFQQQDSHDRYAEAIVVDTDVVAMYDPEFSKLIIKNSGTITRTVC